MSDFLESWGQLTDPDPAPAPVQPTGPDPLALVDLITASDEALAKLATALADEHSDDKLYVFATLPEFLEEYLLAVFHKPLEDSGTKWCEQWWRHREARAAFTMLWDSWESHRRAPASMTDWLVHRAWPIMDRLTGPISPFDGCKHTIVNAMGQVVQRPEHNPRHARLPVAAAPEELFAPRPTKTNPHP